MGLGLALKVEVAMEVAIVEVVEVGVAKVAAAAGVASVVAEEGEDREFPFIRFCLRRKTILIP
jgi:hypothetical protein